MCRRQSFSPLAARSSITPRKPQLWKMYYLCSMRDFDVTMEDGKLCLVWSNHPLWPTDLFHTEKQLQHISKMWWWWLLFSWNVADPVSTTGMLSTTLVCLEPFVFAECFSLYVILFCNFSIVAIMPLLDSKWFSVLILWGHGGGGSWKGLIVQAQQD